MYQSRHGGQSQATDFLLFLLSELMVFRVPNRSDGISVKTETVGYPR